MEVRSQLESWYESYSQELFNFLVYYNQTDDVDDLVQEVFIKAWKNEHTFQAKSSPKTWLFSIARRVSIDYFRKKKLMQWFRLRDGLIDSEKTPEEKLMNKESHLQLYNAINNLKRSYRDVVICKGIMELSTQETADVLQWNASKVDTTYHRAKAKLGNFLESKGRVTDHAKTK